MIPRKHNMDKLIRLRDEKIIKVITGVRRCGKSTLLQLYRDHLIRNGVAEEQIVSVNLEDISNEPLLDYRKLYAHVMERLAPPGKMTYVFLDEVQKIVEYEKVVDSLFIQENMDVYITGSNAHMLSGDIATLLSGRYIEISMLPFSFREFFAMKGGNRREAFEQYYRLGGFPFVANARNDEVWRDYLQGIYDSVLLKDIVTRKRISDVERLESVIRFLFDNIGSIVSAKKIADSLTSYGRKTTSITVEGYITALRDAFILYKAGRYDIKGKQYLKSLEKYYVVDIGLRNLLLGERNRDIGHILENIIYLELIRRGYSVRVGKVDEQEIDFIAEVGGEKIYYQVAASVMDPMTFDREFGPLLKVKDHFPKFVLTMDELPSGENGIRQLNIIDFLLDE